MTPSEKNKNSPNNTLSGENLNLSDITYSQATQEGDANATIIAAHTEIHSGPLPPPMVLKEYDQIIHNGAERIMAMDEKQQDSRIEGEKATREINSRIADQKLKLQRRGQTMALIVVLLILGLVVLFTFTGHETVVYILLGIGLAGVISAFTGLGHKKNSDND